MDTRMAADGGLRRLFENPMPENPTLMEALSAWNHRAVHPDWPVDTVSFTEIFGELHFQEKSDHGVALLPPPQTVPAPTLPPPRTTSSWAADAAEADDKSKDDSSLDALLRPKPAASTVKRSASFCMNKKGTASSLLLCTEGLGSESTVDADDVLRDGDAELDPAAALLVGEEAAGAGAGRTARVEEEEKEEEKRPPPIRAIGRGGKPCVCFRSVRADGRFVLTEVVIPGKELLQACRDGGRLRLQFAAGVSVDEEMHGRNKGAVATEAESKCRGVSLIL